METVRESSAGTHFYFLYRNNPHEWYLKYILGLIPKFTKPPFVLGKAIHAHNEEWWKERDEKKAFSEGMEVIEKDKRRLETQEDVNKITESYPPMVKEWISSWIDSEHGEKFTFVEAENPYEVKFGPDESLTFTFRPDLVIENKETGYKYITDYKHTGYSPKKFYQIAERSDQITAYLWALSKAHPEWRIEGGYIDGIYRRGKSVSADHYFCYRTEGYKKVFELGLVGTILEVSQKVKALSKYPWPLLFPPNWSFVEIYGSEYEQLLGKNIGKDEIPPGYEKDPTLDLEETLRNIPDWNLDDLLTNVRRK
jgi:hypothetical protein